MSIINQIHGEIITSEIDGKSVCFFITKEDEHIQRHHKQGKFYEEEELALLKKHMPDSPRILEVGANIGNHLIYYHHFIFPRDVVWIEPNPIAYEHLQINLRLNQVDHISSEYPDIGLSDRRSRANMETHPMNVGGARAIETQKGNVELIEGDHLLQGRDFDFIKLDTEVQDIEALVGLSQTILRCRPLIFVEIFDQRCDEFTKLTTQWGYEIIESTKMYKDNSNYLIRSSY